MPQNACERGPNAAGRRNRHRPAAEKGYAMVKTWGIRAVTLAAMVTSGATAASAQSAQTCGPRDEVIERLASKYGETRQSMGLNSTNTVMEVFASLETGTWTITVTTAQGMTCLVASGQAFQELAEALPKGDPA